MLKFKGVDVSLYQGDVDWKRVRGNAESRGFLDEREHSFPI